MNKQRGCGDGKDPIKVFCRLHPLEKNDSSCITVISSTTISITSPESPQNANCRERLRCSFNHVFDELSTQEDVFNTIALPLVIDLLKGKNGLLIACGNSGSGKTCDTYSMRGNSNGILPCLLDEIFTSIGHLQTPKFLFKSDKLNGFDVYCEGDAFKDRQNELVYLKTAKTPLKRPRKEAVMELNQRICLHCAPEDKTYAIFVSFVAIHNNEVYDLLEVQDVRHQQAKILHEDSCRNMYVHGAVEKEVKTSNEAYQLYMGGLQRKESVAKFLNSAPTRLHAVFNIRVVQADLDPKGGSPIPDKNAIQVSQLSIVDVARPERAGTKKQLKESGHINNSLQKLKMCMDAVRKNRVLPNKKLIPYRDTKLTYLFKKFFEDDDPIHVLVCVNQSQAEYKDIVSVTQSMPVPVPRSATKRTDWKSSTKMQVYNTARAPSPERPEINQALNLEISCSIDPLPCLELESPENSNVLPELMEAISRREGQVISCRTTIKGKENDFRAQLEEMETINGLLKEEGARLMETYKLLRTKNNVLESNIKTKEEKAKELLSNITSEEAALQQELNEVRMKRRKAELENRQWKAEMERELKISKPLPQQTLSPQQMLAPQQTLAPQQVHKADVVPTAGGGAQFIFNNAEMLRQHSPLASPARNVESATVVSEEDTSRSTSGGA